MRDQVSFFAGVLRGMKREEECELLALKESSQTGTCYQWAFILQAPDDLPNGEYVVSFDDHAMLVTKERAHWHRRSAITSACAASGRTQRY